MKGLNTRIKVILLIFQLLTHTYTCICQTKRSSFSAMLGDTISHVMQGLNILMQLLILQQSTFYVRHTSMHVIITLKSLPRINRMLDTCISRNADPVYAHRLVYKCGQQECAWTVWFRDVWICLVQWFFFLLNWAYVDGLTHKSDLLRVMTQWPDQVTT